MLSCSCDFDPSDYGSYYYCPTDFSKLSTSRRKRCCSCRESINISAIVVKFDTYRQPRSVIEERCKGEEVQLASRYMCEKCGEIFLNLTALGYCVSLGESMSDALLDYHEMTGFNQD